MQPYYNFPLHIFFINIILYGPNYGKQNRYLYSLTATGSILIFITQFIFNLNLERFLTSKENHNLIYDPKKSLQRRRVKTKLSALTYLILILSVFYATSCNKC